jgi:hypothetical protein
MKTLIIGSAGSMGQRYRAILEHLKQPFDGVDREHSSRDIIDRARVADRIIVAVPTDIHNSLLKRLIPLKKPILCEKPIVNSTVELKDIFNRLEKHNTHFTMMFQYSELVGYPHRRKGPTSYDYFRSGKDGLVWDCLQVIALANDTIELKNTSPVWKCTINGTKLDINAMDAAYLSFVNKWITNKHNQKLSDLMKFHKKTEDIFNASN